MGKKQQTKSNQNKPKPQPNLQQQQSIITDLSSSFMGIDFGTHYACVGVFKNDRVEICPNQQGNRTTPSIVAFSNDDQLVGDEAKAQMDRNPMNSIYDVKNLLGRDTKDLEEEIKNYPFKTVLEGNNIGFEVSYKQKQIIFTPIEIARQILAQIRRTAETFLGESIKKAVITVPSHFTEKQKTDLREAALTSGITVMRFIDEHVSVALAYGYDNLNEENKQVKNILIFDLGGNGLSTSIVKRHANGLLEVIGNETDMNLSGEQFDKVLVNHLLLEFNKKYKCNMKDSARSMAKLKSACEKAKRLLSQNNQASIELDSLFEGYDFFTSISKARFEDLAGSLIRGTIKPVQELLKKTQLEKENIDRVILVGGGSKIPSIQKLVEDFFQGKQELIKSINQDEVVCIGATLQANVLHSKNSSLMEKKLQVSADQQSPSFPIEMLTLNIGIGQEASNKFTTILPESTRIPCKRSIKLNSTDICPISIYQGPSSVDLSKNQLISKLLFPKGTTDITFEISDKSLLKIFSKEKSYSIPFEN